MNTLVNFVQAVLESLGSVNIWWKVLAFFVILLLIALLFYKIGERKEYRKRKEEALKKEKLAKERSIKEIARQREIRNLAPFIFSKGFVNAQDDAESTTRFSDTEYFFGKLLSSDERAATDKWFDWYKEAIGVVDCERIIHSGQRPLLSLEEFLNWFKYVFEKDYFDFDKKLLLFGSKDEMSKQIVWAQSRLSFIPVGELMEQKAEIIRQGIKKTEDIDRIRITLGKILVIMQGKAEKVKSLIDSIESFYDKGIVANVKKIRAFSKLIKRIDQQLDDLFAKLKKAQKGFKDYQKSLSRFYEYNEVKGFFPRLDILKEDIKKIVEEIFADQERKLKEKLDSKTEEAIQVVSELKREFQDIKDLEELWKIKVQDLKDEWEQQKKENEKVQRELRQKIETIALVSISKQTDKNSSNFTPSQVFCLLLFLLVVGGLVWAIYFAPKDQRPPEVSFARAQTEEDLLSDNDGPVKEAEITVTPPPKDQSKKAEDVPKADPDGKPLSELCKDKECCLEKYGKSTDTWLQAVRCMREIEKK